jgi:hypothetical protein
MVDKDMDSSVFGGAATDGQQPSVAVRVRLLINADGKWAAYGWTAANEEEADEVLFDMMGDNDVMSARSYYLTARIPLPQSHEIAAAVEAVPQTVGSDDATTPNTDESK